MMKCCTGKKKASAPLVGRAEANTLSQVMNAAPTEPQAGIRRKHALALAVRYEEGNQARAA
jgi:hypothetical protein